MLQPTNSRVLMLSITPFKGGGETHDAKLASLLAERYDVHGIVCNSWLHAQMVAAGVTVTKIEARSRLGRYWQCAITLLRKCLTIRPRVVHLNGQGEAYFAPLLRLLGLKTIIARHAPLHSDNSWFKQKLVNACYRCGDRIICVSGAVRLDMEAIIPLSRLITIPNWINATEIIEPRTIHVAREPFRLLFIGRLVKFKGASDLIAAMRFLVGCELDIVGDGPDRQILEQQSKGLPVRFHGLVDNCRPFFDDADLFVFPSYPSLEGQGQTPLEAMARGLPCLVSDIQVAKETMRNGEVAGMFRCGDVQDLADQVNRMRDPTVLMKFSDAGVRRVKDSYSDAIIRPLYFKLFDSFMEKMRVSS